MYAAQRIDSESSVLWDLHWRVSNLGACVDDRSYRRSNVINQPVRPDYRLFSIVHGRPYADQSTIMQLCRAGIAESRIRFAELQVACCSIGFTSSIDVFRYYFKIV